jgi:hydroxypyruvate isomerase
MPRFAANVSLLFTEEPFLERFAAAAKAGFKGVECQFPYHHEAHHISDKLAMAGVKLALFNAPPGNFEAGERGLAALPGREIEFRDSLDIALSYADEMECTALHVMAGCVGEDQHEAAMDTYLANLAFAAERGKEEGVRILIEPIVMDNYFLTRPDDAVAVIEAIGHKNLALQYDVFHAQRSQGNIAEFIETHLGVIGHIQIAGVPGRHEPDKLSEVNWRFVFDLLDAHGYGGWIGAEYNPRAGTLAGLTWARDWGIGA